MMQTQASPTRSRASWTASFRHLRVLAAVVASIVVAGAISPEFLRADNVANLVIQLSPLGIVVIGQTLVILVAGLDLSVASVMATSAVLCTLFPAQDKSLLPILIGVTLLGVCVGAVNGLLITRRNVSPFLATLSTMIVLVGVRLTITHGAPSGNLPPAIRTLAVGSWGGVPYSVLILSVFVALTAFVLQRTTLGRHIRAVGSCPDAAEHLGYPLARIKIGCYIASSVLAAWAGVLLAGYVGSIDNWVGRGYELDSIVAAVVGGVALSGGIGTVAGALSGTAILMVVSNVVLLLGLPIQLQLLLKGAAIIVAASIYVDRKEE